MKNGWNEKTLGDVLQRTETVNPLQSPNKEFEYIDVSSVSNITYTIQAAQRLKGADAPSRARRLVKTNDVLFATVRPTLQRIALVPADLDGQVCSTGYFVLRPKHGIEPRFIFYFLFSETFRDRMERLQKGASYPAVTDSDVRTQPISIPSLPVQRRIIGILDGAFESIATAKANAEKNLQNARALFESHLDSVLIREQWMIKTLEEVCIIGDGNHSSNYPNKHELVDEGVPFIRATNIVNGGISDKDMRFLTAKKHAQLKKGHLRAGDILFTNRGEIGKTAVVDSKFDGANLNSQIAWFRSGQNLNNRFLFYFLNSGKVKAHVEYAKNGAALQQFTIGQLKKLEVPIPSKDEQLKIVRFLDELTNKVQRLESIYERKCSMLEILKKSLLHEAFSGNL